jgi:hypothetical protein
MERDFMIVLSYNYQPVFQAVFNKKEANSNNIIKEFKKSEPNLIISNPKNSHLLEGSVWEIITQLAVAIHKGGITEYGSEEKSKAVFVSLVYDFFKMFRPKELEQCNYLHAMLLKDYSDMLVTGGVADDFNAEAICIATLINDGIENWCPKSMTKS